jgi:hypothetical protein
MSTGLKNISPKLFREYLEWKGLKKNPDYCRPRNMGRQISKTPDSFSNTYKSGPGIYHQK